MNNNYPPFYIGQKVVALMTKMNDFNIGIIKYSIYIVKDVKKCFSCNKWSIDVGLQWNPGGLYSCPRCVKSLMPYNRVWVSPVHFAPLLDDMQTVTFEKIVEKEPLCAN